MKSRSVAILLALALAGCGGDSSSSRRSRPATDPINPPPSCKSIFDRWVSNTTTEDYDFASMQMGQDQSISYVGFNNQMCGPGTGRIDLFSNNSVGYQDGFTGYLQVTFSGTIAGSNCDTFPGGGVGKHIFGFWRIDCVVLTMCQKESDGSYTCREFH